MRKYIGTFLLLCASMTTAPAVAEDIKQLILNQLRGITLASGTSKVSSGASSRAALLEKLRNRLPDQLKQASDALQPIPVNKEIAIGRQIAGNLLGAAPLVDDAGLQKYVNQVGRWVANQSERPDLPWHFGVIDSTDINAFAAPGGYVLVTRGLYALLKSEAELASVLAHEVGHVIRRHHLEILQKSQLLNLGRQVIPRKIASNALIQGLIGQGAEIVARALDQKAEFEADSIAVVLTARSGYDAFALPAVLQQIGHYTRDNDKVALLFKTHPHPDTRLEKLDARMGTRLDALQGLTLPIRLYRLKPAKGKK